MAGWNDYEADFTSPDTLRLLSPLDGIRPIIAAINERRIVRGRSLVDDIEKLDDKSFAQINGLISGLRSGFIIPDSWVGTGEFKNWSGDAALLEAIGATEFVPSATHYSAEWLHQQYLILNKLTLGGGKLVRYLGAPDNNVYDYSATSTIFTPPDNIVEVQGFNKWSECWDIIAGKELIWYTVDYFEWYSTMNGKILTQFTNSKWGVGVSDCFISIDIDMYKKFSYKRSLNGKPATYLIFFKAANYGNSDIFYDYELGLEENKWGLVAKVENTLPENEYGQISLSPDIMPFPVNLPAEPIVPVPVPGAVWEVEHNDCGLIITDLECLIEHAVPGGFEFVTPGT